MPNYTTGLECSKAIKEAGIDVRSEKLWFLRNECLVEEPNEIMLMDRYSSDLSYYPKATPCCPSYSLSELSEVFRLLGEKKGWEKIGWTKDGKFYQDDDEATENYICLCRIWNNTQSQEKCDEYLISLL